MPTTPTTMRIVVAIVRSGRGQSCTMGPTSPTPLTSRAPSAMAFAIVLDVAMHAVEDNLYRCSHVGSLSEEVKAAREERPGDVRPFSCFTLCGNAASMKCSLIDAGGLHTAQTRGSGPTLLGGLQNCAPNRGAA